MCSSKQYVYNKNMSNFLFNKTKEISLFMHSLTHTHPPISNKRKQWFSGEAETATYFPFAISHAHP